MKAYRLESSEQFLFDPLFDTYIINEIESFEVLMQFYDEMAKQHRDASILITLDNLNQAMYTSTYAIDADSLDITDGHDLSSVDASAFKDGRHLGYLTTRSERFIREANFEREIQGATLDWIRNRHLMIMDTSFEDLERANQDPFKVLDAIVLLKVVPTRQSSKIVMAFPNGYFAADLDPSEVYVLAEHLRVNYQYEHFGIGATLLGFRREHIPEQSMAEQLAAELVDFYHADARLKAAERYTRMIMGSRYLFLNYTDNVELF